ncbi:MAG: two-component regulator propeller domain-containing protein [Verrucomicrobiota bacterium]
MWNEAEGIGNNVRSVLQTADGFIWIVANGKLMRFDGVRLEHFPLRELGERGFDRLRLAFALREGGFALAMTDGSFARISSDRVELITTELPSGRVETIIEEPDGTLLLSFDNDALYRWREGRLIALTQADGLPPGSGSSHGDSLPPGFSPNPTITADEQNRVWIARDGMVGRLVAPRFETLIKLADHRMKIAPSRGGGIWISSGLQLFHCNAQGQLRPVARIPAVSSARVSAILEDHSGAVWVGAPPSGLFRYNGTDFQSIPISHREVVTVTEDRERNLWVGTSGGGLNLVQPRILKIEGAETGLPFQAVQSICEDREGTLWAVTQQGTPVRRVDGIWQDILPEGQELGEEASCIAVDPTGAVWIGTVNHRVFRWERGKLTSWGRKEGTSSLIIRALYVSKAGDVWIAGGRPGTLQRFRQGERTDFKLPVIPDSIWAIAEGANGEIWAGGTRGTLFRVTSDDRVTNETPRTSPELSAIRALHSTSDGTLWLAYELGGIGRLKDGKFNRFTAAHGLADDNMRQVISDGEGWLWFVSLQKLFKIRQAELDRAAEGESTPLQPIYYGEDHGVRLTLGRSVGAVRTRDGLLWLPLATSLAIVNPRLPQEPLGPPPVFITKVAVDDHVVSSYLGSWQKPTAAEAALESSRLAPDHRRIEIDFTAISFSAPRQARFQYRLDGFDDEWSEPGPERKATYGRLPSGAYQFRVKASNSDGLWNETGATVALIVEPFLWEHWWFRATVVVVFAGVVFAATRYVSFRRLRAKLRVAEQATALEQERTRIARDIHDDLGSRLTRIMMLSRLAAREANPPEATSGQIREISEAAQQLMKSLDETVWAVNPRNDDLPNLINYMSHYAVKFLRTAGIECLLDLPDDPPSLHVSAEMRHHVYMAMKEALNNIVRHAQATQVQFAVTFTNGTLSITLADNGVGLATGPTERQGNGLTNMAQRLKQIGGTFEISGAPGGGTRVSLSIDVPKAR